MTPQATEDMMRLLKETRSVFTEAVVRKKSLQSACKCEKYQGVIKSIELLGSMVYDQEIARRSERDIYSPYVNNNNSGNWHRVLIGGS